MLDLNCSLMRNAAGGFIVYCDGVRVGYIRRDPDQPLRWQHRHTNGVYVGSAQSRDRAVKELMGE